MSDLVCCEGGEEMMSEVMWETTSDWQYDNKEWS